MKKKTNLIQKYLANHIKKAESCGLDNFYLGFLWRNPKTRISKNDFINEVVRYCTRNRINVKFEFDRATDLLVFP